VTDRGYADARQRQVLVTGGGTGIGFEVVRDQLRAGFKVWGVGLDEPDLDIEIPDRERERFIFIKADVTDQQVVSDILATVASSGEPLGGLVNCAGVYPSPADIEHTTLEMWQEVMAVNVTSAFLMCRAAIPLIRQAGGGSIVNIGSVHAVAGAPGQPVYAASKAALAGLTRQLAVDYAHDAIRVNCLLAGAVDTRITRHAIAESGGEQALGLTYDAKALGRIAQPLEVAQIVTFLLSPSSSFITGAAITADGGMTARIL
jgi:NAD(P)-dependent dehydrogenase (short-subunit alcohol dehydrogenase family)